MSYHVANNFLELDSHNFFQDNRADGQSCPNYLACHLTPVFWHWYSNSIFYFYYYPLTQGHLLMVYFLSYLALYRILID
jgi:hypothetical protein